jgi:hypothetical protein
LPRSDSYSIFEYFYRDAGNYKTQGTVLLAGRATPAHEAMVRACLDDACFVAEQVGISPLQPQHLQDCGSEMGELDHGFHEFSALRAAEAGEVNGAAARMTVVELVQRFRETAGRWDPARSPFGR